MVVEVSIHQEFVNRTNAAAASFSRFSDLLIVFCSREAAEILEGSLFMRSYRYRAAVNSASVAVFILS